MWKLTSLSCLMTWTSWCAGLILYVALKILAANENLQGIKWFLVGTTQDIHKFYLTVKLFSNKIVRLIVQGIGSIVFNVSLSSNLSSKKDSKLELRSLLMWKMVLDVWSNYIWIVESSFWVCFILKKIKCDHHHS